MVIKAMARTRRLSTAYRAGCRRRTQEDPPFMTTQQELALEMEMLWFRVGSQQATLPSLAVLVEYKEREEQRMATKKVCDECGNDLPTHYLEVRPVSLPAHPDGDTTFLDGSWNGGEFCSRECLIDDMRKIEWPHEHPRGRRLSRR